MTLQQIPPQYTTDITLDYSKLDFEDNSDEDNNKIIKKNETLDNLLF